MNNGFVKVCAATPVIRVADVDFNTKSIIGCIDEAEKRGAKILALPELCVTGYTCSDLFMQRTLLDAAENALSAIADATKMRDMLVFVGLPVRLGGKLYNCAAVLYEGEILGVVPKTNIPNYGSYYEKRYFISGRGESRSVKISGRETVFSTKLLFRHKNIPQLVAACEICEDLWVPVNPSASAAVAGATVIVNLSASDESLAKDKYRRELTSGQSARLVCGYIYADAGEGESTQDSVFTGHSLICENGAVLAENLNDSGIISSEIDVYKLEFERTRLGTFEGDPGFQVIEWGGDLQETELTRLYPTMPFVPDAPNERAERCERALYLQCLGLKRRIQHTGAKRLVVGVSGGLDSTLTVLVCAEALKMLGRPTADLLAITMPGFGTTVRTKSNAEKLANVLGAEFRTISIGEAAMLHFEDIGHSPEVHDVVYENAQARERTQVLMDIANGCGGIVIGTGDMSELALGWATYNGDHMSMYCVNGSVPKTMVRYLVGYVADTNPELTEVLTSILDTPVSPELLPAINGEISQKTEDLVGPYELHDFFLYYGIRWGFEPKKVLRLAKYVFKFKYDDHTIIKWLKTFYRRFFNQQFKRSCLPDGPKIGTLTLSPRSDWRMPSDASSALWLKELEDME